MIEQLISLLFLVLMAGNKRKRQALATQQKQPVPAQTDEPAQTDLPQMQSSCSTNASNQMQKANKATCSSQSSCATDEAYTQANE
jgi:hypothetical protein